MSPGLDSYHTAKYCLRIHDVEGEENYLVYFQMSTPFPRYEIGDKMMTHLWPIGPQGKHATVERVYHGVTSSDDDVRFYQDVYCRFELPVVARQEDPPT